LNEEDAYRVLTLVAVLQQGEILHADHRLQHVRLALSPLQPLLQRVVHVRLHLELLFRQKHCGHSIDARLSDSNPRASLVPLESDRDQVAQLHLPADLSSQAVAGMPDPPPERTLLAQLVVDERLVFQNIVKRNLILLKLLHELLQPLLQSPHGVIPARGQLSVVSLPNLLYLFP
jgi:hypothetical protein